MLYKVFDFADKEAVGRDGAAARGRGALRRDAARGGTRRGARLAVHALPGLPRVARRHRRRAARPRPGLGAQRPRHRRRRAGRAPAPRVRRAGDEGSRRAARRVPAHEPAHGDRRRRVRLDGWASSRSRTCSRRSSGTSRTSSTCPTSRSSGSTSGRSGSTARSPSTTSTRSSGRRSTQEDYHTVAGYVFDHLGRAAEPGDEVRADGLRFTRARDERLAHPPARGRVPAGAGRLEPGQARGRVAGGPVARATPRSTIAISSSSSSPRSRRRSRSRCRSSRSAGRSTRSAATRSISGSSAWRCSSRCRCSPSPPGICADRSPRRTVLAVSLAIDARRRRSGCSR